MGVLFIQRHKVSNLEASLPYLSPCPMGSNLAAHLPGLAILHLELLLLPLVAWQFQEDRDTPAAGPVCLFCALAPCR